MSQLLIELRFYAAGTFQVATGDVVNVSQPRVCWVVERMSRLIAGTLFRRLVKFPSSATDFDRLIWPSSVHESQIFDKSRARVLYEHGRVLGVLLGDSLCLHYLPHDASGQSRDSQKSRGKDELMSGVLGAQPKKACWTKLTCKPEPEAMEDWNRCLKRTVLDQCIRRYEEERWNLTKIGRLTEEEDRCSHGAVFNGVTSRGPKQDTFRLDTQCSVSARLKTRVQSARTKAPVKH
ncbi:hypothetical protein HPB47_004104 [Ixodes persulcatus]|uniref:Uncharacterized protein n=1 Tax=Ixodes persulcatus TaxID=34615 RepID=A0AC60PHK8_IXOPE|nr:hypothetical protein HPB47_004104 [Ixodes persulcatus]